jgi:hypothetical protein
MIYGELCNHTLCKTGLNSSLTERVELLLVSRPQAVGKDVVQHSAQLHIVPGPQQQQQLYGGHSIQLYSVLGDSLCGV